jgi:tetratricopeptide (TPR) repeat protein
MNMSICYTKRFILFICFILCSHLLFAAGKTDSLKQRIDISLNNIDSLKKQLRLTTIDSLKGPIYSRIASQYLNYDTITNKKTKLEYQEAALSNTYLALHFYSRYNDTVGLRLCFDNLAKVYHAQKKYAQAKWFILQSNTLSRTINDNQNIIISLLELASIKSDIKDYSLAMRDLNEALTLSSKKHYPQLESQVQVSYAMLYSDMKNLAKAAVAMKRHVAIDDSIKKAEEAVLLAKQRAEDSLEAAKKKAYLISSKKPYAFSSSKKPDSLQYLLLSSF